MNEMTYSLTGSVTDLKRKLVLRVIVECSEIYTANFLSDGRRELRHLGVSQEGAWVLMFEGPVSRINMLEWSERRIVLVLREGWKEMRVFVVGATCELRSSDW